MNNFFSFEASELTPIIRMFFIFPAMMSSHVAAIGQKSDTNFTSSLEDWKVVGVTNRCCGNLMTDAYHVKDLEQHEKTHAVVGSWQHSWQRFPNGQYTQMTSGVLDSWFGSTREVPFGVSVQGIF